MVRSGPPTKGQQKNMEKHDAGYSEQVTFHVLSVDQGELSFRLASSRKA